MAAKNNAVAAKTAFLNSAKKHADKWKQGREAKPGDGYKTPEIEDGLYPCKVTGGFRVGDRGKLKGHPIIELKATVDGGDYDGIEITQMYDLAGDDWVAEAIARDLKCILPDRADDISGAEMGDLVSIVEEIAAEPVSMEVEIKNSERNGKKYVNPRFPKPAEDGGEGNNTESSDDDDNGDDATDDDDNGDDDSGDADEFVPEKGDKVTFKHRNKDVTGDVITVNKNEKTARVKANGKTLGPFEWDKLTLVEE